MGIFASLVGFQSMAVVSPLVTLLEKKVIEKSSPIYLLPTIKSLDNANRIKEYIQSRYEGLAIHLKDISTSLKDDKAPQIVLNEVIQSHDGEKIYFNLAGAMNYQISACILALQTQDVVYVYPESEGIRLFEIDKAGKIKMSEYETLIETNFEAYFRLQGIKIKTLSDKVKNPSAQKILDLLINRSLADTDSIIYSNAVVIGNVLFHYVYNSQNELIFVLNLHGDSTKESVRKIINLATNRHDFGELLHRKIVVITSSAIHKERLQSEAGGKVIVIDPNESSFEKNLKKVESIRQYKIETIRTGKETVSSKSLYLSLGTEIMPTLIALWSHQPKRACIIYTPQDETVQRYKKAMVENKELLPCSEIVFIPTDITGKEILNYKPQADEEIECNITPGTKAQGVFLSIFAKMHNGTVWSISQDGKGRVNQIPQGDYYTLKEPKNIELLALKGFIVNEYKTISKEMDNECRKLISFLMEVKDTSFFMSFPKKNLDHNKWQYIITDIRGETPVMSKLCKGNDCIKINVHMDKWYEDLTAWVLKEAGATDIILNYIRQTTSLPNQGIFSMSEMDILATYFGKRFVVSCKTSNAENIFQAISDLKGTVSILGRFAIPLLSFFRHKGEPKVIDGVYVYGVDTLCDTEKMRKLLNDAIKARRTTAEEV